MRSRVEIFEQIRRDRAREGLSIHELADRHHVHRRTVRQSLSSALPPPRKSYPPRARPAIEAWTGIIDGWLEADKLAPPKQERARRQTLLALDFLPDQRDGDAGATEDQPVEP